MFNSISALLKGYNKWQQQNYSHLSRQRRSASCLFLPNPSTNNGEREHRRHIEHIIERSMKNNHTGVCATIINSRSSFLLLGGSCGIFPHFGRLTFSFCTCCCMVSPRGAGGPAGGFFWCRLCDAASLKQQLLFRITFAVKLTVIADLPSLVLESIVLSPWKLLDVMGRESSL